MQVVRMRRLVRGRNLTTYTIDLRTRVVPETLRIWRLFPGKDYIFLPDFQEQSVVFLDFPGLPLPDGPVSESLSDLAERIMVSNAVSEWARRRERADPSDRESRASPSRDPADYVNERRPRNLTIDKGAIAGFSADRRRVIWLWYLGRYDPAMFWWANFSMGQSDGQRQNPQNMGMSQSQPDLSDGSLQLMNLNCHRGYPRLSDAPTPLFRLTCAFILKYSIGHWVLMSMAMDMPQDLIQNQRNSPETIT
jgi:hypothetical protein